ncbi:hypothetical protein Tco_1366574, partial [Tanacetum coccineum]
WIHLSRHHKEAAGAFYNSGLLWSLILFRVSLSIVVVAALNKVNRKSKFRTLLNPKQVMNAYVVLLIATLTAAQLSVDVGLLYWKSYKLLHDSIILINAAIYVNAATRKVTTARSKDVATATF